MKESELLTINIKVFELDKPLNFTVPREQEELYRKAAVIMNTAIQAYRKKFQLAPIEKLLSMVTLSTVVTNLRSHGNQDMEPLLNELENMNAELEAYLNQAVSK